MGLVCHQLYGSEFCWGRGQVTRYVLLTKMHLTWETEEGKRKGHSRGCIFISVSGKHWQKVWENIPDRGLRGECLGMTLLREDHTNFLESLLLSSWMPFFLFTPTLKVAKKKKSHLKTFNSASTVSCWNSFRMWNQDPPFSGPSGWREVSLEALLGSPWLHHSWQQELELLCVCWRGRDGVPLKNSQKGQAEETLRTLVFGN